MIPFTQFLMPDGRRQVIAIDRPAGVEAKAQAIIAKGFAFEIEMLSTGAISMEIIRREPADSKKDDTVIASDICHNGPTKGESLGVPESVDKMIAEACRELNL